MILNIHYKFIDFNFKLYSLHFTNDAYICNENDARGNLANFFSYFFSSLSIDKTQNGESNLIVKNIKQDINKWCHHD